MRVAAILLLLLGLGLVSGLGILAEHADADLLPPPPTVPSVTVPSVTVPVPPVTTVTTPPVTTPKPPPLPPPPVTVPSVTTPSVSTPRVTTPVSTTPTPSVSVPSVTTPQVSVGAGTSSTGTASSPQGGGSAAGGGPGAGAAGGGSSSSGGGAPFSSSGTGVVAPGGASGSVAGPAERSAVSGLHTSRPWIGTKGSKQRRGTTLTFVMRHRGRVIFTVQQVSPACRTVGRFVVHARKGVNRVRFTGRVGRRSLVPGTYFLEARTASGRVVERVTLVVVNGLAPGRGELQALRTANVCAATTGFDTTSPFTTGPFFTGAFGSDGPAGPDGASRSATSDTQSSGLGAGSSSTGRILASAVERTARAIQPVLVALLGVAILLLGLASLPQAAISETRFSYVLARHRPELAALGAGAFAAVVIAFLIA